MPEIVNAFTIDVEDWFHILELEGAPGLDDWSALESRVQVNTERLLALLESAQARCTCFVLGWVAECHPETVRRIAAGGHEVASHGYGHELVPLLGPENFRADLERSIEAIEAAVGQRPAGYRAPGFSISEREQWALETVAELGLAFDSSIFPAQRAHGGAPGAERLPHELRLPSGRCLPECPISVTPFLGRDVAYCGGGYLRLFPYSFIRSRIAAANARGEPVVLYIHPRDIDPDQPRIPMPLARRFKSYVGLAGAYEKVRRLLGEFRFGSVSEALRLH